VLAESWGGRGLDRGAKQLLPCSRLVGWETLPPVITALVRHRPIIHKHLSSRFPPLSFSSYPISLHIQTSISSFINRIKSTVASDHTSINTLAQHQNNNHLYILQSPPFNNIKHIPQCLPFRRSSSLWLSLLPSLHRVPPRFLMDRSKL